MATKLTPEQKAHQKAMRLVSAEADRLYAEEQRQRELVEYKASVPKRLMEAQALASWLGIAVHVSLTATGPSVRFKEENHYDKLYIDETITYETEEWVLESLEATLASLKTKRDAYDARRIIADGVWSRLSDDEKFALKEHFIWMRT